jgi:hypothetical protein
MVSVASPRRDEHPDDLLVVDSPPLRGRLSDPGFADNPPLSLKPSFGKRAARAVIRFLIACGIGVAGTLAWQSYGDAARQTIATWGAEYGWSMAWLSPGEAVNAKSSRSGGTAAVPAAQAIAPDRGSSSDLEQLKTMTLGLAATLTTMRERIEQVAAGQEQTGERCREITGGRAGHPAQVVRDWAAPRRCGAEQAVAGGAGATARAAPLTGRASGPLTTAAAVRRLTRFR